MNEKKVGIKKGQKLVSRTVILNAVVEMATRLLEGKQKSTTRFVRNNFSKALKQALRPDPNAAVRAKLAALEEEKAKLEKQLAK